MHTRTLQFPQHNTKRKDGYCENDEAHEPSHDIPRSRSLVIDHEGSEKQVWERMKYTVDYLKKGSQAEYSRRLYSGHVRHPRGSAFQYSRGRWI